MFLASCLRRVFTGAWDDDRTPRPSECVFCAIAQECLVDGTSKELVYKDAEIVAFKDRSPAAFAHFLVCPREHIASVRQLEAKPADAVLAARMLDIGRQLVASAAPGREMRFGYHVPPFNSVNHLHLHCFALPFTPCWKALKYVPAPVGLDFMFMSADNLQQRLGSPGAGAEARLAEEGAAPAGSAGQSQQQGGRSVGGGGGGGVAAAGPSSEAPNLTTSLLPRRNASGSDLQGGAGEAGAPGSPGGGYGAFLGSGGPKSAAGDAARDADKRL